MPAPCMSSVVCRNIRNSVSRGHMCSQGFNVLDCDTLTIVTLQGFGVSLSFLARALLGPELMFMASFKKIKKFRQKVIEEGPWLSKIDLFG